MRQLPLSLSKLAVPVMEQRLRGSLMSMDGLDPQPDREFGRWWEPLQIPRARQEMTAGPREAHLELDSFTLTSWQGWLSEAQTDGRMVPPGTYTRLVEHVDDARPTLWMTDTPSEILDHLPFVWMARGKVLVTGLGIGMVTRLLLKKATVTELTVVERDPRVIELWQRQETKRDRRLTILRADAMEAPVLPAGKEWDWAWHDIWPDQFDETMPEELAHLQRVWSSHNTMAWGLGHLVAGTRRALRDVGVRAEQMSDEAILGLLANAPK